MKITHNQLRKLIKDNIVRQRIFEVKFPSMQKTWQEKLKEKIKEELKDE